MRIYSQNGNIAIVEFLRRDCETNERGRKKWWADKLGVSPMMLSHWLVGRRRPNAAHISKLFFAYEELKASKEREAWSTWLWQNYYDNKDVAPALLKNVAQSLMKADGLQSRTLALLSWFFSKSKPMPFAQSEILNVGIWNNKIGWLYESAGLQSDLKPERANGSAMLLDVSSFERSDHFYSYLERQQTELGRKWRLYDCPLDELKEKLDWRQ